MHKRRTDRHAAGPSPKARADREELFVAAYIANGFSACGAAITAGFSPRTASNHGARLLKMHRARIDALIESKKAALYLTGDEVLRDLAAAMRFDPRRLFHEDGRPKLPHELSLEEARQIEGYEVETEASHRKGARGSAATSDTTATRTVKIKVEKHIATREQAMKHLRLFPRDEGPADPEDTARKVREFLGDVSTLNQKRTEKTEKEKGK